MNTKEFKPSKYQENIFDFIKNGSGNLVVEAVAGSGKSTTLTKSMNYIPSDKKVLFLAFNKTVADTLKKKTEGYKNVTVMTVYGAGFKIVIENFKFEVDKYKYDNEFNKNSIKYTNNSRFTLRNKWKVYRKNVIDLVKHTRLNLGESIKDIIDIAKHFEITPIADEVTVAYKLIKWGKENRDTIDYPDMIWYPIVLDLKSKFFSGFDFVFVDEAQDLSKCQREFILKYGNENTRYIFVGDSKQAIYGFNSADPESFAKLKEIPNTITLPLSVCYRCPKKVVSFVKHIVPQIEHAENAIEGSISFNKTLGDINDGDAILCRNNAPLMQIYMSYLRIGKPAYMVKDEDTDNNAFTELIASVYTDRINVHMKEVGLMSELYRLYFRKRKEMMTSTGLDAATCDDTADMLSLLDKIESIKILSEGLDQTSQLIQRIDRLFGDKNSEGIRLSTVHKAKGDEFPNVFIAKRELFDPSKKTLEWEKVQEENLEYVAYTRAKRNLSFIKSDQIQNSYSMPLDKIESIIDELYDKSSKHKRIKSIPKYETVSGVTTPGVITTINDDREVYSHTMYNPLTSMFNKKSKKKRKI